VAPAAEPDPQKRALLVLRWFLSALKQQYYVGRDVKDGVKKPLNAFLGEIFLASWTDGVATTEVISEQVSHHPPITACYLWNDEHGIRAEGYSCQETTFSGYIHIKQIGHAILHIDKFNEDYLLPLPDVKAKGFLTGAPYPELNGSYHIISSTGYTSEIKFSESGVFSGARNRFNATLYRTEDESKSPIYTASGQWSGKFVFYDSKKGVEIDSYDVEAARPAPISLPDLADQDAFESRKAWKDVIYALRKGDLQGTVNAKSKLENAQRALRRKEVAEGTKWEPLYFSKRRGDHTLFHKLAASQGIPLHADKTFGVWKFDREKARKAKQPYRGMLTPFG
jgi:oxysterol-binding protein-related protein 9/10/11